MKKVKQSRNAGQFPKGILCLAVIALLFISPFAVYGGGAKEPAPAPAASSAPAATTGNQSATGPYTSPNFPLFPQKTTLRYFAVMNGNMTATMRDYNGVAFFQKVEEASNVHIEWIHPAAGAAGNEQFAIMVSSSDLPELIDWKFGDVRGGAEALIRDKVLMPFTLQEAYRNVPNYMSLIDTNKGFRDSTLLDDGTFYQFVRYHYDWEEKTLTEFLTKGPFIRMDWVRKVGKQMPTTVAELYDVLLAIKKTDINGKGVGNSIPFAVDRNLESIKAMAGLFGTRWGEPHVLNGKVVYGPMTPNYRKYVETMAQWYKEELINNDFPVLQDITPAFLNSDAAFTIGSMGSQFTAFRNVLSKSDPTSDLDSIPYPKGPDGFQSVVDDVWKNPRATALSATNKYPAESLKWIDYRYSEQGSLDSTFGVLGESYNMVNGKPVLTDLIVNPPAGLSGDESMSRYALGPITFPYGANIEFYRQLNLITDWQKRIQPNWITGARDIILPPITLTTDEMARVSSIMSDIRTYVDEMTVKFIVGQEPLSRYDQFVQNIRNMSIDRAVQYYQAALDRYNSKK